ncbi:MAG: threonine/serine dehydratase [Candidatus Aminicenantales bacterium]
MMNQSAFKERVDEAWERIRGEAVRTPLCFSPTLSRMWDARIFLKWENEQRTGSFKFRGALNKLLSLSDEQKRKGIFSASTGNHGLGLSLAAQMNGIELTLFLPEKAAPEKVKKLKEFKVHLNFFGSSCEKAEMHARQAAQEQGKVYVSPYNDFDIVYGQGTLGIEIFKDLPDVEAVLVPVGGGGLISGLAGYLKAVNPMIQIFGVEPANSSFMSASLTAGRIVDIEEGETLADAVAGGIEPGAITFPLCQKYVDGFLTVPEDSLEEALALLFQVHHKVVEGAGALPLAGLMETPEKFQGRRVVLLVSGGNIAGDLFLKIVRRRSGLKF